MIGLLVRGFAPALFALGSLGACVATGRADLHRGSTTAVAPTLPADAVVLRGARAFAVAEIAYTTAARGAARLVREGLIRGTAADRLRAWNDEARRALTDGKRARDTVRQAQAAATLLGVADRLDALGGKR